MRVLCVGLATAVAAAGAAACGASGIAALGAATGAPAAAVVGSGREAGTQPIPATDKQHLRQPAPYPPSRTLLSFLTLNVARCCTGRNRPAAAIAASPAFVASRAAMTTGAPAVASARAVSHPSRKCLP